MDGIHLFTMSKCLDEKYKKVLRFLKTADMDIEDIEVEVGDLIIKSSR